MCPGWGGVRQLTELRRIRIVRNDSREQSQDKNDRQRPNGDSADRPNASHCALSRGRLESELTATVIRVMSRVRLMISGKSLFSAACHASCPTPGESQRASIGIAAPKAILRETPRRANNAGATRGRT